MFTVASYGAAVAGGTTILLTTHNLEEAAAPADRVAIIAAGRLVAVDSAETIDCTGEFGCDGLVGGQ